MQFHLPPTRKENRTMANTIKFTEIDRPISTPADKLEDEANDILADVVYGKSPYADKLEAQAGKLLVKAAKMRLISS
jgi:hypothetical protein